MNRMFWIAVVGVVGIVGFSGAVGAAATPAEVKASEPSMIESSGGIHVMFGPERLVLPRGLQPSMLVMRSGGIVLQAQVPEKSFPSKRMAYPSAMSTRVSRDGGETWTNIPLKAGVNGLDMEGGIVQLRDGTILALDTYITPGATEGHGVGELYESKDEWRTVEGPIDVDFDLPGIEFYGSTDDGGRPHAAERLHRRILEMPDGSLLTTFYGWLKGDHSPSQYEPTMMKTRVMVAKSEDRGRHWKLLSALAADFSVGTEGFGEAVLCRVSHGALAGRLICMMRTGRALHESVSDDNGVTWTKPAPRVFAGLDVYKTELWANLFIGMKNAKGKVITDTDLDDLRGAVVDPDLIETRSGILVAAFGVRIPQKLCWRNPTHPWNGNYLAFSRDGGKTWPDVARITSGVLTTHYMAVEETPRDNELYVTYDLGGWSRGMSRDVFARTVTISVDAGKP
jgi:hypothetical protein